MSARPLRVWLVDDDASIRWVLERALKSAGMLPRVFESAEPALDALRGDSPDVLVTDILPVGHYAVKPKFSDGHESGIFSWDYIAWLGENQDALWADYLARLKAAGASREPDFAAMASDAGGCGKPGCGSGGCGSH